uniref:Uncharacterized protein n=1 Tax=Vitis vinifera TaxID=29760 RepID=F6GTD6_VITVI
MILRLLFIFKIKKKSLFHHSFQDAEGQPDRGIETIAYPPPGCNSSARYCIVFELARGIYQGLG